MKAVRIHAFGGPEVLQLEEVPRPMPAPGEVLVKVYASGVNPLDWKIRKGLRAKKYPTDFPLTLGWDMSGVVEEVGSGVHQWRPGDEVYGRPDPTRNGTYAEYVAVKADQIGLKPKTIDHVHAAAVPLAGMTAWQGLFDHGHLERGQTVLIQAASGGVGIYAVQFARWVGARVYGTTSTPKIDFVQGLGADVVIDYTKQRFEDVVHDADLVLDTLGGDTQKRSLSVIRKGGRIVTTLAPEDQAVEAFTTLANTEQLETIARLIDEGKVHPVIARVFPLEQAAAAQELSETGHVQGKIVLQIV
ncbi:NADP-dependent oxidoreductase [Dinghuibacter silviterrae]|uniref:NADPH:quinone reductase-like Zn-dependent oxidoreductase n=1 Tax=Dinghuibacter silviterrae TaxID=1539049 RepID=A0A4R8DF71_9BACT|nr:NADP-dependent oxidoreductase [Dinghuibacter silviterrae]TDW96221.1 NADPH:quinone reductase-like Zn-dependent oxidoreductase [Dinghuibacter silviterrae]